MHVQWQSTWLSDQLMLCRSLSVDVMSVSQCWYFVCLSVDVKSVSVLMLCLCLIIHVMSGSQCWYYVCVSVFMLCLGLSVHVMSVSVMVMHTATQQNKALGGVTRHADIMSMSQCWCYVCVLVMVLPRHSETKHMVEWPDMLTSCPCLSVVDVLSCLSVDGMSRWQWHWCEHQQKRVTSPANVISVSLWRSC